MMARRSTTRSKTDKAAFPLWLRFRVPSPAFVTKNCKTDPGVTNIRNTKSPHWRRWLGVEHRCVVPFTSFSVYDTHLGKKKVPTWFAVR
jgi:putative SOS response-associated peptidase YedK